MGVDTALRTTSVREHPGLDRPQVGVRAGAADERPPEPLDSAILFAPAGELVPPALEALDHGGTLALAGIETRRGLSSDAALSLAAALARESRHPAARAIAAASSRPARPSTHGVTMSLWPG